jgi:hypothetical protein
LQIDAIFLSRAIQPVAGYRMTQRCQVLANLMLATGFNADVYKRPFAISTKLLELNLANRFLLIDRPVDSNWIGLWGKIPADDRAIALFYLALAKEHR